MGAITNTLTSLIWLLNPSRKISELQELNTLLRPIMWLYIKILSALLRLLVNFLYLLAMVAQDRVERALSLEFLWVWAHWALQNRPRKLWQCPAALAAPHHVVHGFGFLCVSDYAEPWNRSVTFGTIHPNLSLEFFLAEEVLTNFLHGKLIHIYTHTYICKHKYIHIHTHTYLFFISYYIF